MTRFLPYALTGGLIGLCATHAILYAADGITGHLWWIVALSGAGVLYLSALR